MKNFDKADKSHIHDKKYVNKDIKAHQDCNLNFKLTDKIPVIFHNLRGYDSHFIMQQIGQIAKKNTYMNKKGEEKQMNIKVIPSNMEKYMAFMLSNNLAFIDSFQ